MMRHWILPVAILTVLVIPGSAQPPAGRPKPVPQTAKARAPFDLTGYWVAQITEDWSHRIMAAPKGDVGGIPLNPAGRQAAAMWDPEQDAAAGNACKAYGVGGILRMPGRLHITWEGEDALKIETDSGEQTRMLSFDGRGQAGEWQGVSAAAWDQTRPAIAGFQLGGGGGGGTSLKVVTTDARPGYLARNGVPYSAKAAFTEYYDLLEMPEGSPLLAVSVEVTDPVYLSTPYWYSVHFLKEDDGSGWNPQPCSAK